jgi:hypothetical protein
LRPTKKIIVDGGCIYASCGVAILPALVAWHKAGADPYKLPVIPANEHWSLMVIDCTGIHIYWDTSPYPQQVDPPFGIGSGSDYAVGAMDFGASPTEAVRIAIRRSINCGGEVQVVNIAEALGQIREAAE